MPVFDYKGCALNYWIEGPAGAPIVVFTPGAFTDHTIFDAQVESVCRRYRMLRWDVRGHGKSRPAAVPFSPMQAADDLAALLDHVGAPRVALVGHSIGGTIAQDFIAAFPDRCAAVVFLGSTANTYGSTWFERLVLRLMLVIIGIYPMHLLKRQSMQAGAVTKAARTKLVRLVAPLSANDVRRILLGIATAPHNEPSRRITCPAMIAYGERDHLGNVKAGAKRWAARIGAGAPVVIRRAGHFANMDNAKDFNRVMTAFLEAKFPG